MDRLFRQKSGNMWLCGVVVIPSDFEDFVVSKVPTTPVRTRARPILILIFFYNSYARVMFLFLFSGISLISI
ncbi:hypothetical protein ASPFODRAFT_516728 [Aspergillus luchuensis CBS 106.47]|uniref:Uncharacterized protein n=1 Tax=Aspergillus luchuensis (strain CBS 106.47) TaxID=1137211 RepID=A0A1M3TU54_ASPLC|nr:hypothetical protein ASPFODRAFT_516728 [Aspergillus luchuensis CBS 106.47]